MLEHIRSVASCRLKKKGRAFAILFLCALLYSPSPTFASSEFGRRGGFVSLVSYGDGEISTASRGDVTDGENGLCHRVEGSPGRFPYLCSLRMAGTRKHECTAALVGERWVLTAAHCVDPNFEGSVGCYPTVYCGIYQVNTTTEKKRFHVEDAYIHRGWTGNVSRGSDLAMLKLDKAARLKTPRLFRNGMVLGKKDMLTPGWEIGDGSSNSCGYQSYLSMHRSPRRECRGKGKEVPGNGWLCFCGEEAEQKTGLDGGPLVLADVPCAVGEGTPSEDLVVGVTSFDPEPQGYGECSIQTSVAYYRDWILKTMAGKTPPSKCNVKEWPPLPSDPHLCEKCEKCPKEKYEPPATPSPKKTPPKTPPPHKKTPPKKTSTSDATSETSPTPSPVLPARPVYPPKKLYNTIILAINEDNIDMVLWVLQNSLNPNTLLSNTELTTGGLADKSTLMFWATVHEATKSIGVLANRGADVNRVDAEGRTSVYLSAMKNITSSLTALIDVNADLNIPANNGKTALHEAVMGKFVGITKTLVENKADINAPGAGKTPLQLAWDTNQTMIAEYLVEEGANVTVASEGRSLFYDAVLKGSRALVLKMIKHGVDVDEVIDGKTPLFTAVETGYTEIASDLIAANADVNIPSATGWTVLHIAVEKKYPDITKLLIESGAKVNAVVDNRTPLLIALEEGHTEIATMLIQAHAAVDYYINDKQQTPLHIAVEKGYIETVIALIEGNASVNATSLDGKTPLYTATELGNAKIVSILIAADSDVNTFDAEHKTALHLAAEKNFTLIVMIFIDAGADVNIVDTSDNTALHAAVRGEFTEIVEVLVEKGADTKSWNRYGMNALHIAVETENCKIVKFLLKNGADPKLRTETKDTALHLAARRGRVNIIEALLHKGAKIDEPDEKGRSPLCVATDQNSGPALEALLEHGADIEFRMKRIGKRPLMLAAEEGNERMIEILIAHGAEVDAVDRNGNTALHYAARHGQRKAAKTLLEKAAPEKRIKIIENKKGDTPYKVICQKEACAKKVRDDLAELLKIKPFVPGRT